MDASLYNMQLDGQTTSGKKIIQQHSAAAAALANCVKSTLGPCGLNKLMIDGTGEAVISNDGSTILKQLQIDNPIGSLIVDLASEQDREVGDGTTTCTLIASEFLKSVERLVDQNVHTSKIISGFKLACKEACRFLMRENSFKIDISDEETVLNVAKTSISSKILSDNADYFSRIAIQAVKNVKSQTSGKYLIDNIVPISVLGQSIHETEVRDSLVVMAYKLTVDMPDSIKNAKIACLDFSLSKGKAGFGIQIVVNDPKQLESVRDQEIDMGKKALDLVLASGANVIFTTGSVEASHARTLAQAGVLAANHINKQLMKRIASVTGATVVKSLAYKMDSNEHHFEPELLGHAGEVGLERFGDMQFISIKETSAHPASSLIVRGPNNSILEEVYRSMNDCMCTIKRTLESKQLVAGGGASEAATCTHLQKFSYTIDSAEQLAVWEFANALKIIPNQLAINSGCDATEIVGDLLQHHTQCQNDGNPDDRKFFGLDLVGRKLFDCRKAGILDPLVSKVKILTRATEALVIITKIDNVIKNNAEKRETDDHGH